MQIRNTSCLEGFAAVTVNLEMIFQNIYIQISEPRLMVWELSFILFSCWHNIVWKITGFSIIHSFFFLLHGVVQTSCYQPLYVLRHFSQVKVFETPWTIVHQASRSMGFSRQEYWSGSSFPSRGDLPHLGIESVFPALADGFFTTEPPGKPVHNAKAQIPC